MRRTTALLRGSSRICILLYMAFPDFAWCLAEPPAEEAGSLPLSAAYMPAPGWTTGDASFVTTVDWEGQEYSARDGMRVLMQLIMDPETDQSVRTKALGRLGRLASWFPSTDYTPELIALYGTLRERSEKAELLVTLMHSDDPRALPLYVKVIDKDEDKTLRFRASAALAKWNIRSGVADVVRFLDCTEPVGSHTGSDAAANLFRQYNNVKSWGCPEEEIRLSIGSRSDVDQNEKATLYIEKVREWFAENEHRFPDWKLGDPLPAASKLPPIPPGPTSVLSLSATFRPPPTTWTTAEQEEEKVAWEGEHLPVQEGVERLMTAILDSSSGDERILAILRLEQVAGHLGNTERIPQLLDLYERLTERPERAGLLFCLAESRDPRALPLFASILEGRTEHFLRLPAAYGLAVWNVRHGVSELIELLLVKQTDGATLYPADIAKRAARLLSRLNYWKSWWAPDASLQAAIEAPPEVRDERMQACHSELKEWFAANKHRFPEWKPADPLPAMPDPESNASDGE